MPADPWFTAMAAALGGWPDDYLCIDVETNGLDIRKPSVLPVEIGYCLVQDGQIVENDFVMVNWALTMPDPTWFWDSLRRTRESMESHGHNCHATCDRVAQGAHPAEALPIYRGLLETAVARNCPVVGHNIWAFDLPLLSRVFFEQDGNDFTLPGGLIYDLGMIAKAHSGGYAPRGTGVPAGQWYAEVAKHRGKGKWNLVPWCHQYYALPIDPTQAHGSAYDCRIVHHLLNAMKALSEDPCPNPSSSPQVPTPS